MSTYSEIADIEWLTGDEAGRILADLADDNGPLHATVARLRRTFTAARTHLLVEQVDLRRRAAAKFTQPDRMFFTRLGLEQSTDEWTATYKANRLLERAGLLGTRRGEASPPPNNRDAPPQDASPPLIADLCTGIGGDLMALTRRAGSVSDRSQQSAITLGIDHNPTAAHFAAINSGAPVHSQDITTFDLTTVTAWHIDPDRRATGNRTTTLDYYEPNLATLEQLLARNPNAAIKLAPATKVPPHWEEHCELEWISRDRECKQQVAWHAALAEAKGQRRATVLTSACGLAQQTVEGPPNQPIAITPHPHRYIFDIDPAVTAARLTGTLAFEHSLSALAAGPTYLTGPTVIHDPALSCFEVDELLPFETRKLAQHLRALGIGQLEIKKRGLDLDPDKFRRDLKLRGPNAATLLITPIAGRPTALRAHRVAPPPTP
jgi:THUMP domain-containing protein